MKHLIKLLCSVLLTLVSFRVSAQTLNINQYGIEDGLARSSIYSMLQDKQGNLWFGTMAGVSKYNGLRFENFSKPDSLAEYRVTASTIDKAGNIWFGHWNGGITKYNPTTKKFHPVKTGTVNVTKYVTSMAVDSSGNVWFATAGMGVLKYTPTPDELKTPVNTEIGSFELFDSKYGMPSNNINHITVDTEGPVYIATDAGVVKTENGKTFTAINGTEQYKTTALKISSDRELWVGTEANGLLRINLSSNAVKNYTIEKGLVSNNIRVIIEDADHNIFVGTYGGGVSKHIQALENNDYQGPIFQSITAMQGLSNDKVLSLMQDREKNIWIGTYLNLNQFFDEQFEIFGESEGLKNSLVWSVIEASNGKFYLGTEGGMIEFTKDVNPTKNTFINIADKKTGISNTTALCEDNAGNIWFTNYGTGVSKYNIEKKTTTLYTTKEGLPSNEINSINKDKNGNIWLATNNGACKVNSDATTFETYTTKNGLGSNKVFTIYSDKNKNLWLGCLGGGLTMYDGNAFKTFTEKEGYNNEYTLAITQDNEGNMWFGSFEKGIYKYDFKEFKNYSVKEGASSNQVFMLACDNMNNLWVGNNQGIDKFNLKDETFKHYGKQDGFLGVEINPNAVCKDTDGNLWFGSIIGLVKYTAKSEKNNKVEPLLQLRSPRLFFNEFEMPANNELSYNQNHLTFDFIGASLTNPKRVKYKWILEGYDKELSEPSKQNAATYSNLPPGTYTFKVFSANNDGIWNTDPQTFTFTIKPPFWKTWWFWTIVGVVVFGLIIFYVRFREKQLKERNQFLEQKVQERTEDLRKEKEVVERQNQNIKDSIDYAQRIQESVFIPIPEIKKILPDFFILFRPKDVVSGDFYWAFKKNGKVIFTVADCTGHGVPGAFMSMIGVNLLNNVVKDMGITRPSLILDELSKQMTETLNPNADGQKVKDGMDMAVCSYDPITRTLEYAGAHNAMYHIRKGELKEYKSDKQPIGKTVMHDNNFKFTNHSISIESGDHIFLFTDGYADCIGGPKKTKFFYPPFRKLLTENTLLPLDQQEKKLDQTITEWLGAREQIDDIAVMGVRF